MKIPLRLVVDTNVVLDLYHFKRESVAPLAQAIASGAAIAFTCERTLGELAHILEREHFHLTPEAAQALVAHCRNQMILTADPPAAPQLPQCRDHADQKFIELAWQVGADYLVTRDKAVLKLAKRLKRVPAACPILPEKLSI